MIPRKLKRVRKICPVHIMKVDRRKLFSFSVIRDFFLVISLVVIASQEAQAADLVIRIPGDLSQQDGHYRLDFR